MCRINPRVDFAFKKLFGSEENKDILIDFINSIVSEEDRVKEIILKNPYNAKNFVNDKYSSIFISAIVEDDRRYNIEIQIIDEHNFAKRALFNMAKLYTGQLQPGHTTKDLNKTICINILNFNLLDEPDYHNVYKIINTKSGKSFFDEFEIHVIELAKYDEKLVTLMDRWVNFLSKAGIYKQESMPKELTDISTIQKAFTSLETMYFTDEEKDRYESGLKWLRDVEGGLIKAEEKGIAKGMTKGLEKGKAEGKAEGLEEGVRKTALNFKKIGVEIDKIIQATGLSKEEIDSL